MNSKNSFKSEKTLDIDNNTYKYFDVNEVAKQFNLNISQIPISLKILLENLLRNEDGESVNKEMISSVFRSLNNNDDEKKEISFFPTRVLMQDFTGVPVVADLAAMRNALKNRGCHSIDTIAYYPHVDIKLKDKAVDFGTNLQVTRNQLFKNLNNIFL